MRAVGSLRGCFVASIALLACACGRAPPPRTSSSARLPMVDRRGAFVITRPDRHTIGYSGTIEWSGVEALVDASDGDVRTLLVRSTGGEIGAGTAFGEWVRNHELDVVVVDYCLSSCANYVFPAGKRKTLLPGAVVAWHGNARQRGLDDTTLPGADAYLAEVHEREDTFFARIGVSECVCRIGNERLGAPGFYTMTVDDMRRFGIDDVTGGPAREADVSPAMRAWIRLSFVSLPSALDVRAACP